LRRRAKEFRCRLARPRVRRKCRNAIAVKWHFYLLCIHTKGIVNHENRNTLRPRIQFPAGVH